MVKQMLGNTLLNLGVIILLVCAVNTFRSSNWILFSVSIASCIVFIYLKIKLLKNVKENIKQKQQQRVSSASKKI